MPYIVKQTLKLEDLVTREDRVKTVLLYEPEECVRDLYCLYLERHGFTVVHCTKVQDIDSAVSFFRPHVLVFSVQPKAHTVSTGVLLRGVRKRFPHLPMVTIGQSGKPEHLKELILAGATSHIERKHSRPEDLVIIIKTLLEH